MKEIDWEILIKYLDGNSSESERVQVLEWINSSPAAQSEFERIKKIWNVKANNLDKPDLDKALKAVLDRIQPKNESAQIFNIADSGVKSNSYSSFVRSSWIRAAALVLITLGAIYIYLSIQNYSSIKVCQVSNNKIDSLMLSDGTKIIMDAGSSLKYPESFNGNERRVELKGEAFFNVTKNQDSPFIINAENGVIKVLGTQFNIRAWKKEKEVTVSVQEGKVAFQSGLNNFDESAVILTDGKMSRLNEEGIITGPVSFDISTLKSWMKKEFYFLNAPLETVLAQLERWYDVKFEISNPSIQQNKITVFIQNRPLEENIKLISEVLDISYEMRGKVIKLNLR